MAIKYLDKIASGIPTTIIQGQDVSNVMLINPPSLPPFLMVNKAVLDTASNSIKVYDESGNFSLEIDLSKADLTPVIEAIEAVDERVDDTNSNVSAITLRIETNEGDITDINAEIVRVEGKLDSEILRINANENGLSEVKGIAEAADTLSKANAERLDAIDPEEVGDLVEQISTNKTDIADIKSDQAIDQAAIKDNKETTDEINENIAAINLEISATNELAQEAKDESAEALGVAGSASSKADANAERIDARDEDITKLEAYLSGLEGRVNTNETNISTNVDDIKTATANAATAQARADSAYEKAKAAQDEAIGNSVAIAANSAAATANKVQLTSQKEQIRVLEGSTAALQGQMSTVKHKARRNQIDIGVLEQQLPKVEAKADEALGTANTNAGNIDKIAEVSDEKFEAIQQALEAQEEINSATGENFEAIETKIGEMDTDRGEIRGIAEGNAVDIGLIQTELGIEGLGGYFKQGEDLIAGSVSSRGSSIVDGTIPDTAAVDSDLPPDVSGTFQYFVKKGDGTYQALFEFDENGFNLHNKPLQNLESGGDTDTNAANIGDVKRIAVSEGGGLKPVENKWDMLTYPLINAGSIGFNEQISSSGDGAAFARFTTGDLQLGASGIVYIDVNGTQRLLVDNNRIDMTGSPFVLAKNSPEEGRSPHELINWETLQGMPDKGLTPFNDTWFMDGYPMVGVPSVGYRSDETGSRSTYEEYTAKILADNIQFVTQNDSGHYVDINFEGVDVNNLEVKNVKESSVHTNAATVGQVKEVEGKIPDVSNYVETGTTAELDAVVFGGGTTKIDHQDELGLVLEGESIYGKTQEGVELFFVENGNFNVKSKKIQKVRDGVSDDDAATVNQVNAVETKVDNIVIPPDNSEQVEQNKSDIAAVKSTADAADELSKANQAAINNLPPIPSVENFIEKDTDATLTTLELQDKLTFKTENGGEVNFNDILKFNNGGFTKMAIVNSTIDVHIPFSMSGNRILNLASGEDGDTNAANIGDVKRIAGNAPDLDDYAKLDTDVSFHKVSPTSIDFTDADADTVIQQKQGKKVELKVGTTLNAELTDSGMKFGRDVNASNQNINNMGDINFASNAALVGHTTGDLAILNLKKISRNDSNDANSVTLDSGFNTYKSNTHNFETNDGVDLISVDTNGIHIKNTHANPKADTNIRIDSSNQNTIYDNIGLVYFNTIDKDSGEKKRIFLTSQGGATTFDHAVRSKEGFTNGTATFNTNTDKAAFVDFRTDSEVKLGAHSQVKFAIAGKTPVVVKPDSLDFSSLDSTMKINHDHNIDVIVSGTTNVAFKSNGMKLLAAVDGNAQSINHSGDIHFNENKKLFGSKAGNLQLRYVNSLWYGDGNGSNIQFNNANDVRFTGDHIRWYHTDGTQYGGISKTGINLRNTTKIVGLPQGEDDTDATNIGHIKELIEEYAPSGGGGVDFQNYINRTADGSKTFYETTSSEANAWITHTNNSQGTITYTFDYSRQGQEVVAAIENKSKRTIIAKMKVRQSIVLTVEVPKYSVFTARYVPEIGKYVYNIGTWYPTEQRVIHLDELTPVVVDDHKQMTLNIIAAMPNHTTLIGYHNPDIHGASKYKFITNGKDGSKSEGTKCTAVIHKHTAGHATGISTTEKSGRVYSRVLDGTTGIWNTNDTSHSFSLAEDIPLDEVPEDQIFFTGDQGMVESYFDGDELKLRPIEGYNVPKQEQDIQALQAESDSNKVITKIFKNENLVTIPYTQEHPVVEVFVLDGSETINGSGLTVIDDNTHKFSGVYNTVGSVSLYDNKWSTFSYHNAYKHVSENYYVVFDQSLTTWVILDTSVPHTSVGEDVGSGDKISLDHTGLLPESFGDYNITLSIDDISSLEFIKAEANTRIDSDAKTVIVDFGVSKPSGKIVIK